MNKFLAKENLILKKYFGYDEFRKGQHDIIKNILQRKDTLAIMPTGGGKSICFQIPALIFEGVTVVISPLISLMKDQVDALNENGIPSVFINSSLSNSQCEIIYNALLFNKYKIIYIAPERLENSRFLSVIKNINVSQIAVDEAHCISQWGHDFRVSYKNIKNFIQALNSNPVISAFTATATPEVTEDILESLNIKATIFKNGFKRDNLKFSVFKNVDNFKFIQKFIEEHPEESGIIYTSTRKECEQIYEFLFKGKSIAKYHAGLSDNERMSNQEDFLLDRCKIIVATNAFGMGIDKSNVRWVIHNNLPKDIESYYQEAGRAGRDGLISSCILLYNPKDIIIQKLFIENENLSPEIAKIRYSKLSAMENYTRTNGCLIEYIVNYFENKPLAENCGMCGNCENKGELIDITIDAQKIISCVGRLNNKYGAKLILDILKGSNNARIRDNRLNEQSTYGCLKDKSSTYIKTIMDYLIGSDFIESTEGKYPLLKLKENAYIFIKSKETLSMRVLNNDNDSIMKKERPNDKKTSLPLIPGGEQLFNLLSEYRSKTAHNNHVPSYIIFSDKTIIDICNYKPREKDELLKINGIGEAKFEKYGNDILSIVNNYIKK